MKYIEHTMVRERVSDTHTRIETQTREYERLEDVASRESRQMFEKMAYRVGAPSSICMGDTIYEVKA